MGAGSGHRLEEEGAKFRETGRDPPGGHLFLAFPAEFLQPDHAHGAGGPLELMEDAPAVLKAALGEGRVQVRQLVASVRFEVAHDREEEFRPAGGHGVELDWIEEGHAGIIRTRGPRGKSKRRVDQGELFPGERANTRGIRPLRLGKLWWASPARIVRIS